MGLSARRLAALKGRMRSAGGNTPGFGASQAPQENQCPPPPGRFGRGAGDELKVGEGRGVPGDSGGVAPG